MRQLKNKTLILFCALGAASAAMAGEQTFMSGDVTLINHPYEPVKHILSEPMQVTHDLAQMHMQNVPPGQYTMYTWYPVHLLPALPHQENGTMVRLRQDYQCKLEITVRPDGNIALIGKEGQDCKFKLVDWVR